MSGDTSDTQSSSPEQFAAGDTLVECHAGSRAGTENTTQLIEWVREQHSDEAVRTLLDPAGDGPMQSVEMVQIDPLSVAPRHATTKYSVSGERTESPDIEEGVV